MRARYWIITLAIAVPLAIAAIPVVAFGYESIARGDRIARNVYVEDVALGGLNEAEAREAIADLETRLVATPAEFTVNGSLVVLQPADVGLAIDTDSLLGEAFDQREADSVFADFTEWIRGWRTEIDLEIPVTIDPDALDAVLVEWDREVIAEPAFEGAVLINRSVAEPEYPRAGLRIDREVARERMVASLAVLDRATAELSLTDLEPLLTAADIDAAVAAANDLIDTPVVLRDDPTGLRTILRREQLAAAVSSELIVNSPASLDVTLNGATLLEELDPVLSSFEVAPLDASFEFVEALGVVRIIPSVPGSTIDRERLPEVITAAATGSGRAAMPRTRGQEAAFTTEMAQAMGPIRKVSEFTTKHPCCANRVVNIQTLADQIDGAIVWPGETFSINEYAGKRTTAKGYVRDGAIINGELYCCDSPINIGGGTSQFATTFYNAVFFGCYEDVEHQPHSIYFSRYPYVREATLGWPKPDVIFRNDSETIVLIDTSYTGNSITVAFYGNTGGRECTSERSGNTVTRVMTHPDGSETRESWSWSYRSPRKKTPETTTTTVPVDTTVPVVTTVPTETTTTVPAETTTTLPPETTTTLSPETTTTTAPPPETTTTTAPSG